MVKLIQSGNSLVVTIPVSRCRRFGWKAGQEFDWVEYPDGSQVLKPVKKDRGDNK